MDGSFGMLDFIQAHLIDNLPRAKILLRQRNKMAIEVRLDLTLGFSQKTQAPTVAQTPCKQTPAQGPEIQ